MGITKYWAEISLIISFSFVIIYEYFLKSMKPLWHTADISGYIFNILAFGYIASYFVYFLTVFLPLKKEKKKNSKYLTKQMSFLIKDFNDIYNYYLVRDEKNFTDGVNEIREFSAEIIPLVSLEEKDICEICYNIFPGKQAPTTLFGYDENMVFYTKDENWGELLQRYGNRTTEMIKNLYQFSHLLDIDDIALLNEIEYSTYIQTVCNFNRGHAALHIKRKNWETLAKSMFEHYEKLNKINSRISKKKYR
ncbi:hypothetical protein H1Q58_09630 [Planococcus maritimus]|uniref:Uncharacterized protein n=1 Tax=Planococcus maritimus TaxID=192421 RepID=A0A7D7R879_PLAMR|nr:hypothetical protein [Planococcus maritimus]QMT16238.1 hypothetical protein H1Q58_09630 [Planococcus maritimus]